MPTTTSASSPDHRVAIATRALRKVYEAPSPPRSARRRKGGPPAAAPQSRSEVVALEGLDLDVHEGEFFGLLGPNGAGKSTTIGILTTRVRPTGGNARVAGADVVADPVGVRRRIGVVPQRPNPDRSLDALENLVYHAAYFGVPRGEAMRRAVALLERLGIADKARAKVDELSGGQQQRLMIARALIHEPRVIFMDEPTVGLDPQARLDLWDILRALHAQGRTIVMTTHYMDEADKLCDRLAIVDRGKLLALDTPEGLKARAPGGTLVELTLDGDAAEAAVRAARVEGVTRADAEPQSPHVLRAYSDRGGRVITPLIQAVEDSGRAVHNIGLAPPSLETLFISLTGRKLD
ncbi:MAG TPA: ABC transporter ATP-binding protein [Gemmatimonadaceae bacterium]|nr:ABC transporter ATP-binding protein [Gemmatimonadaceae bacterium]